MLIHDEKSWVIDYAIHICLKPDYVVCHHVACKRLQPDYHPVSMETRN